MSLQNEIDKLKTLQESFNELSSKVLDTQAVLTELNNGKQEIVDALATKNVQSSTNKTLSAIADDVRNITTQTKIIEGGAFYGEQLLGTLNNDIKWNLYEVMDYILSNSRFNDYGGIILAEISKANPTTELTGVGAGGAYFTSDYVFTEYDLVGENAYVWKDTASKKTNRWVAYLLRSAYSNFTLTTNIKTMHIGRKVGIIYGSSKYGPKEVICLDGNEYSLSTTTTLGLGGSNVALRNIKIPAGTYSPIYKEDINTLFLSGSFESNNQNYSFIREGSVSNIVFERIDKFNVFSFFTNQGETSVNIQFPDNYVIDGDITQIGNDASFGSGPAIIRNSPSGPVLCIHGLKGLKNGYILQYGYSYPTNKLKEIICPDLEFGGDKVIATNQNFSYVPNLERIYLPKLSDTFKLPFPGKASVGKSYGNLIDIEVGQVIGNIDLSYWYAINILANEEKTAILLNNIHNHIASKVSNKVEGEGSTITFSQGIRDILLPETEELFAAKNWNIAPAKTV